MKTYLIRKTNITFIKTEAGNNKFVLPEQLGNGLPDVNVFFPVHRIKAAMESYLTRGQGSTSGQGSTPGQGSTHGQESEPPG